MCRLRPPNRYSFVSTAAKVAAEQGGGRSPDASAFFHEEVSEQMVNRKILQKCIFIIDGVVVCTSLHKTNFKNLVILISFFYLCYFCP